MTIANGQTILAADLNVMVDMAAFASSEIQLPGVVEHFFAFPGLLPGTPIERRQSTFVAPCDLMLEVVAVETADQTALSVVTITITGDGELASWPTSISAVGGAGYNKLARLLYDNTKSPAENFALASQAFRVFRKGTTITVTAAVTVNAVAASAVNVVLAFREFYGRE